VEPTGPATSRLLLFDVSATSVRELGTLPAGAPLVATTSGQEVAWTDGFSHVGLLDSTGRSSRVADLATDRPVYGLAIAPDGKQLYVLRGSTDMSDIGYEVRILELPSGAQRGLATSGDALYMSAIVGDDGRLAVAERSAESRARILGIVPDSDRMVELGAVRAPALIAGLSLAANGRTAIVTTWRGRSDAYMIRGPVLQPMADR
jgi:hypothetical protein